MLRLCKPGVTGSDLFGGAADAAAVGRKGDRSWRVAVAAPT
jgi:hypothetical protein